MATYFVNDELIALFESMVADGRIPGGFKGCWPGPGRTMGVEDTYEGGRWIFSDGPIAWLDWCYYLEEENNAGWWGVIMLHDGCALLAFREGLGRWAANGHEHVGLHREGAFASGTWYTIGFANKHERGGVSVQAPREISLVGPSPDKPRSHGCPNMASLVFQWKMNELRRPSFPCRRKDCSVCLEVRNREIGTRLLSFLVEAKPTLWTPGRLSADTIGTRLRRHNQNRRREGLPSIDYVGVPQADGTVHYLLSGPFPGAEPVADLEAALKTLFANESHAERIRWCKAWQPVKEEAEKDFVPVKLATKHQDVVHERLRKAKLVGNEWLGSPIKTPTFDTPEWRDWARPFGIARTVDDLRPPPEPPIVFGEPAT